MPVRAAINHVTDYRYDRPISARAPGGPAAPGARIAAPTILSYALKIAPAEPFHQLAAGPARQLAGPAGLPGARPTEFRVEVDLTADMAVINPFDFFVEPSAETFPFAYDAETAADLAAYLEAEPAGPKLQAFLDALPKGPIRTVDFLVDAQRARWRARSPI